jgi:hypothetical protein
MLNLSASFFPRTTGISATMSMSSGERPISNDPGSLEGFRRTHFAVPPRAPPCTPIMTPKSDFESPFNFDLAQSGPSSSDKKRATMSNSNTSVISSNTTVISEGNVSGTLPFPPFLEPATASLNFSQKAGSPSPRSHNSSYQSQLQEAQYSQYPSRSSGTRVTNSLSRFKFGNETESWAQSAPKQYGVLWMPNSMWTNNSPFYEKGRDATHNARGYVNANGEGGPNHRRAFSTDFVPSAVGGQLGSASLDRHFTRLDDGRDAFSSIDRARTD